MMPTKIFTILGGECPFGRECAIDSPCCRQCQYFYRAGTATFFWCNHPIESPEIEQKAPKIAQPAKKRGRPAGKAAKKPVKRKKIKK